MSATSQALEALRRADDENRARAAEINSLHNKLADANRAVEAAEEARERAEVRAVNAESDAERQTQALNVVLKEVAATKDTLRHLRAENARLRSSLDSVSAQSREMHTLLAAKSVDTTNQANVAHSAAVLYMQHCYALHTDPCPGILRSLFERSSVLLATEASFQQLAVLLDVVRAAPQEVAQVLALELECTGDNVSVVADLIGAMPTVQRVSARHVDSASVAGLADAVRLCEHVRELELPQLRVADAGMRNFINMLAERRELAEGKTSRAPLILKDLDLSECSIESAKDALQDLAVASLGHLDLSNIASLDRGVLRTVLMACPAVTRLVARNCPGLSSDICDVLNMCPLIREVDFTGCTSITTLHLEHVVVLRTTLAAVAVVNCPNLVELPDPCTSFRVIEWSTPKLESIAMHGVSLTVRECSLLSSCASMRNFSLIQCRVSSLETFFKRMRRLEVVNLNGSKGVTDSDVRSLCTTLVSLDLTDSFCITDKAIGRIVECPRLEELTLKRCSNVTDQGVLCLESHESLRYLNVLGTKRITVVGLHRVVESCRNMTHVVHETLLATSLRVDRIDTEEVQRRDLATAERALHSRMSNLSLSAMASPERPHSPRAATVHGGSSPRTDL